MKNLLEILHEAEKRRTATGHFNFSNFEQLKAIISVAEKLKVPVVLGLSEGERDFIGMDLAVSMVRFFREKRKLPVFLNADHTYSVEKVREAAEAGFDSVIFDGAKLPFEENIAKTREAVRAAKKTRKDILVEGEFGYIGQSSQVLREVPVGIALRPDDLPTAEQCKKFVRETRVDLFAPAVGNVHGIVVSESFQERLFINRIMEIRKVVRVPLVLHGGSGLPDDDFRAGIQAGISLIHISTELRVVWRKGVEEGLRAMPDEMAPYKILSGAVAGIGEVVERKMIAFGKI